MKPKDIVPPVLFPFTADELEVLKTKTKYFIGHCDIYLNYNYQELHYELLRNYIDHNLVKYCHNEIANAKNYADMMDIINNSVYSKYYKYFLCLAFKEDKNLTAEKFKKWTAKTHYFLIYVFIRPSYVYEINKIYNSIVIPRIPEYDEQDNMFNRLYGLIPNYYQAEKIFNKSVDCLTEGGRMFILDKKSRELFKNDKLKRIAEDTFEKKIMYREPKRPYKVGWL